MKIHGFSIDAIKSTASLPLPSLRRLFSRDSFPEIETNGALTYALNLGFILTRVYDEMGKVHIEIVRWISGNYATISCDEYDV